MVQIELLNHSLVVILVINVVCILMQRERVLQLEGEVVDGLREFDEIHSAWVAQEE